MSLLSALLIAGPSLLRALGDSKGGNFKTATDNLARVLDTVNGEPTQTQQQQIEAAAAQIDPAIMQEIQLELAKIEAVREQNLLTHHLGMHTQQQKTIRSSQDVSGTRPKIANRHSWITAVYIVGFEALSAFGHGSGASWEIATLLASPVLAWFGFRTWDKFSRQGATK